MKKTMINLAKAFIGESQARNRYGFYAKMARTEGFEQIGEIFDLTAANEREHANWMLKMIRQLKELGEDVPDIIKADGSVSPFIKSTFENLEGAVIGETEEFSKMYPEFAKTASEEGYEEIANRFWAIAKAEEHHAERYKKLAEQVKKGTVFKKDKKVWWVCRECGYVHFGTEPPKECPSCGHASAFYQIKSEEY